MFYVTVVKENADGSSLVALNAEQCFTEPEATVGHFNEIKKNVIPATAGELFDI